MLNHPNFFVIGAQKAGTTYLTHVLSHHSEVYFSSPKELFFFSKTELAPEDYANYLKVNFPKAARCIGEGTTTYLQSKEAPLNIKRMVPGRPLFIVCLRHPLTKALSFYVHNWRKRRYEPGDSILTAGAQSIRLSPLLSSMYAPWLQNWLQEFDNDRSRFLFLHQEELDSDPNEFIAKATRFLDISPSQYLTTKKINKGLPFLECDDGIAFHLPSLDGNSLTTLKVTFAELRELHDHLSEQTQSVSNLIEHDLSAWSLFPYANRC